MNLNNEGTIDIEVGDDEVALEAVEDGYVKQGFQELGNFHLEDAEEALETGEFVTGRIHNRVKADLLLK